MKILNNLKILISYLRVRLHSLDRIVNIESVKNKNVQFFVLNIIREITVLNFHIHPIGYMVFFIHAGFFLARLSVDLFVDLCSIISTSDLFKNARLI